MYMYMYMYMYLCCSKSKNGHQYIQSSNQYFNLHIWQILEMLSEEYGGRVELAKAYYKALTASVRKHFKGNGVISSMQQCNDFMFLGTETISLGRVGKSSIITHRHIN